MRSVQSNLMQKDYKKIKSSRRFFEVKGGFKPVVLKPGETTALVELRLRTEEKEAMESRILDSVITLHTNISTIDLPLVCFHGKVKPVSHLK